jgi:hypothetical protein
MNFIIIRNIRTYDHECLRSSWFGGKHRNKYGQINWFSILIPIPNKIKEHLYSGIHYQILTKALRNPINILRGVREI